MGLFGKEKQERYNKVANDLYVNDKIDKDTYHIMFNKKDKNKDDDFEL